MARTHFSTWLLIGVVIANALIIRFTLITGILFVVIAATTVLIRDVSRMEGRGGAAFGRSSWIAMAVILVVAVLMVFGVRYIAV